MSDTYTHQPYGQPQDKLEPTKNLAGQAQDLARGLSNKAADVADTLKREAKKRATDIGEAAVDLANDAKGRVSDAVAQQKSVGADYIGSIAQSVGRAAGEFDDSLPKAASFIRQASEQIQDFSEVVRERDVRELIGEVQAFARRQPTIFFGGAVVLGFAALRFLKSSAPAGALLQDETQNPHGDAFENRRAS